MTRIDATITRKTSTSADLDRLTAAYRRLQPWQDSAEFERTVTSQGERLVWSDGLVSTPEAPCCYLYEVNASGFVGEAPARL